MSTSRLTVQVDVPDDELNQPTLQDIFVQAMDLFDLAGEDGAVNWALVSVSKNSPMTIVAEPRRRPDRPFITQTQVDEAPARFERHMRELSAGRLPSEWRGPKERKRVQTLAAKVAKTSASTRVFASTTLPAPKYGADGISIALTAPTFPSISSINQAPSSAAVLTRLGAEAVLKEIERSGHGDLGKVKAQVGSITGHLVEVKTHYHKPAIVVRDRITGQLVRCEISESDRDQISASSDFDDVWRERRVRVHGRIYFGPDRDIDRVVASSIHLLNDEPVSESRLAMPPLGDLSPEDYIDERREG